MLPLLPWRQTSSHTWKSPLLQQLPLTHPFKISHAKEIERDENRWHSVISCHFLCFSVDLCLAIQHSDLNQFTLELMCLDLWSNFCMDMCRFHWARARIHVPEIWQHPGQRERTANDQWLDWSVCVCVCERVCMWGGDPKLRTEQLGPPAFPGVTGARHLCYCLTLEEWDVSSL